MTRALLVAHGQPSNPGPIAAELRALARQVAAHLPGWQVDAATLAESGALQDAVARAGAGGGIVFPLFMADGWFTRTHLPQRLMDAGAQIGAQTGAGGWQIADPFGTLPAVQDLAVEIARGSGAARILLAAHGSGRSRAPSQVAQDVAARITARTGLPCTAAFIEEDPRLEQATGYGTDTACLPYFAMAGEHVTDDLPQALSQAGFAGRLLPSLGTDPRVPALVAQAIREGVRAGA